MTGLTYPKEGFSPEDHRFGAVFTEAGGKRLLSDAEQQALIRLIRDGDAGAKQKMIVHNMRLVVDIAQCYANCGVEFLDLVREGALGHIHALENFDLEEGFRFSAYAAQCIRENIESAVISRNNPSFQHTTGPPAAFLVAPDVLPNAPI